jgi:hypothetical protein
MKKNDIVTLVTFAGEFVGKFVSKENGLIELDDPRMVVQGPEGQMGFARGICQTGEENPTNAVFESCVFVTPSNKQVTDAYREHTSGLVIPS